MQYTKVLVAPFVLLVSACSTTTDHRPEPSPAIAAELGSIAERPNIGAIGLAMIRDGEVVGTWYAGDAGPGSTLGSQSWFNAASVAKTIMAETTLRLAAQGRLGLDDPIADFYVHPDLADDPRNRLLTPRIILSHQTGLRNWPADYEDNRLAFDRDPGSGVITYSGTAMEILLAYLEARFGMTYPEIVNEVLFEPLDIHGVSVVRTPEVAAGLIHGRDADGHWQDPFRRYPGGDLIAEGEYAASDNLYATIPGFADLIAKLARGDDLPEDWRSARNTVLSRGETIESGYMCDPDVICPDPLGFGLGWAVFGEQGRTIIFHSGNDFAEHAQVYFVPETRDGLVMFMSGGNAYNDGLDAIEAADPDTVMMRFYRGLLAKYFPEDS